MLAAGAGVGTPATKPGVPRLAALAQTIPVDVTQIPAEQVKPATVDVPVQAVLTAGVAQVDPLQ